MCPPQHNASQEGLEDYLLPNCDGDSKTSVSHFLELVHPQKLTWNLEMMVSNRNLLFQGSIFRFHVCFGGCIDLVKQAIKQTPSSR